MARVIYSSIVSEIAGSIGSCTFQRNAYGNSIRLKPSPSRSSSVLQQGIRSRISLISQAWRSLTPGLQAQFNNFSYYSKDTAWQNNNSSLSGYNIFCKWYFYLLQAELTLPGAIVFQNLQRYTLVPYFRLVSGSLFFFPYPNDSSPNALIALYMSSGSNYSSSGSFRKQKYVASVGLVDASHNVTIGYLKAFGDYPIIGSYVDVACIIFSTESPIVFTEQLFHVQINP